MDVIDCKPVEDGRALRATGTFRNRRPTSYRRPRLLSGSVNPVRRCHDIAAARNSDPHPVPYAKIAPVLIRGALERALNSTPPSATAAWPAPTASIDAAAIAHRYPKAGSNPRVPIAISFTGHVTLLRSNAEGSSLGRC